MKGIEWETTSVVILAVAVLFIFGAIVLLPSSKDIIYAVGGEDDAGRSYFTVLPEVSLKCDRAGTAFTYYISLSSSKVHLTEKTDTIPALLFKSEFRLPEKSPEVQDGVIPKAVIETGNIPAVNYNYEIDKIPPYETESFSLFLFKKNDKCLETLGSKDKLMDKNAVQAACAKSMIIAETLQPQSCYAPDSVEQKCLSSFAGTHDAIDISVPCGTAVKALCGGIGEYISNFAAQKDPVFQEIRKWTPAERQDWTNKGEPISTTYKYGVQINHNSNWKPSCNFLGSDFYGTLQYGCIKPKSGLNDKPVAEGEVIGYVDTCKAEESQGCHLHLRIAPSENSKTTFTDIKNKVCNEINKVLNVP